MQLTRFTDYALRVLLHLGAHPGELATVAQLAAAHGISRHHLTRVVHQLGVKGYIATARGKGGGFWLARDPQDIVIGAVVRDMEPDFHLAECLRPRGSACRLLPGCALKPALAEAGEAFLASLGRYTLADLLSPGKPQRSGEAAAVPGKTPNRGGHVERKH